MKQKKTLKVAVVPVGADPYLKVLEADEDGLFLKGLQECVGGFIEPADFIVDPNRRLTAYVNEDGYADASRKNRAIYATEAMAGLVPRIEGDRPAAIGELVGIVIGDFVIAGFDPECGEDEDITDEDWRYVRERFGGQRSIDSGPAEVLAVRLGLR